MRGRGAGRRSAWRWGRAGLRPALVVAVPVAAALCGAPAAGAAVPERGRDIPDVAVVVTGGTGRTTALRSGEPSFARLWQLLEPTYSGSQRVPEQWTEAAGR